MMRLSQNSRKKCEEFLGETELKLSPMSGGSINQVFKLETAHEESKAFLLKCHKNPPSQFFEREKLNLETLARCAQLRIPEVFLADQDFILMEFIERKKSVNESDYIKAGHCLYKLHQITEKQFGFSKNNFIGLLHQSNKEHKSWASFWIKERLEPQITKAQARLDQKTKTDLEKLVGSLPAYFEDKKFIKPSLLHGDLWGGNHLFDSKGSFCLIDPACYYGHGEVDLAFATSFGSYPKAFFRSYFQELGDPQIEEGFWEFRVHLYQLYLWLIHLNLFGQSYLGSVQRAASRCLAANL